MPTSFVDFLKMASKLGGVGVTMALIMFAYLHFRGYSDQAAIEIAGATIVVAGLSHAIPSPINTANIPTTTASGEALVADASAVVTKK